MRQTKRDELVEKALIVFYENGFHATGMDTLVAKTGISKTSMYKHFRTKEDLILAALQLRDRSFRDRMIARMETAGSDPKTRILALFDFLDEWFKTPDFKGCMFIKASSEFPDENHPIRQQSAEHKRLIEAYVSGLAREAGLRQPDRIARQVMLLKEGAIVAAHVARHGTAARDAKEVAATLLAD